MESLLRNEDGTTVTASDIAALAGWDPAGPASIEIAFRPSRVLMQDFTGVPAIVDLAALRDAMEGLGGDPRLINPLVPVELVIDHSIQVDVFGQSRAFERDAELEFVRNRERYAFLRWGQTAFDNFSVAPPNTGICHQVNLEYLASVVHARDGRAFPDKLVGTDSHTTMVNGLGVLGWGVGGIEAEAAMLGQPVSMLIPEVVGFRLTAELPDGSTATDLVLTAIAAGGGRHDRARSSPTCSAQARARCSPAMRTGTARGADRRPLRLGPGVDLRQARTVLRRHRGRAGRRAWADHRRARSSCWATASPPTTSRPPARSRATRPPGAPCASRAWRSA